MEQYEFTIKKGEDGRTEILYSSLEELQAIWKAMTKGFYIMNPDGSRERWISPREVFIAEDGEFIFKPRKEVSNEKL